MFATARSSSPSPLKSPTATENGNDPTAEFTAAWKVPFPSPSSTLTLLVPKLAVTVSSLPSPLKSSTTTDSGELEREPPTGKVLAVRNIVAFSPDVDHGDSVTARLWKGTKSRNSTRGILRNSLRRMIGLLGRDETSLLRNADDLKLANRDGCLTVFLGHHVVRFLRVHFFRMPASSDSSLGWARRGRYFRNCV